MKLYGGALLSFGVAILIAALVMTIIFLIIHFIRASILKKQLKAEYGESGE